MSVKTKFDFTADTVSCIIVDGDKEVSRTDFTIADVPAILQDGDSTKSLAGYGLLKLVQDRNSDLTKKALDEMGLTGIAAQEARIKAYAETFDFLKGGKWSERKSGGRGPSLDAIFISAVARYLTELSGKEIGAEVAQMKLQGMNKESLAALRAKEEIAAHMADIRKEAQAAADDIDLSDFL